MAVLLLGLCAPSGLCSCGAEAGRAAATQRSAGALESDGAVEALSEEALNVTWQELAVPGASSRPALASTPAGFLALSQRTVGDAKAPSAWESYLYRSRNGIGWERVHIATDESNLWLRGVAYGAGHYVLAGMRMGGGDGVIFHSTDAEHYHWEEIPVSTGAPSGLSAVVFAGARFFALSTFRTLLSSGDGTTWVSVDLRSTVMPLDVTFGNGQYLLVGSGDVQRSTDGLGWVPTQLDCAIPGACITDPGGNVLQGVHNRVVFAGGAFFTDQASSVDGQSWQSLPGAYPLAAVGGLVLGSTETDVLASWKPGEAPRPLRSARYVETLSEEERTNGLRWNGAVEPNEVSSENFPNDPFLPEVIEFPNAGGDNCSGGGCLVVGGRLYSTSRSQDTID